MSVNCYPTVKSNLGPPTSAVDGLNTVFQHVYTRTTVCYDGYLQSYIVTIFYDNKWTRVGYIKLFSIRVYCCIIQPPVCAPLCGLYNVTNCLSINSDNNSACNHGLLVRCERVYIFTMLIVLVAYSSLAWTPSWVRPEAERQRKFLLLTLWHYF